MMWKWWIEREDETFDHVCAHVLDVTGGTLVFQRYTADMTTLIPVLVVSAGTYLSVHLDEDQMNESIS